MCAAIGSFSVLIEFYSHLVIRFKSYLIVSLFGPREFEKLSAKFGHLSIWNRAKEEALRIKKKIESDINDLEIALDAANKANAETTKTIKRVIIT